MTRLSPSKLFFFGATLSIGFAVLVFSCGDDANSPAPCQGATCDGGSESSTNDGPGADTNVTDGGGDGDSSLPIECDGSGAGTLDPTFGDGGIVWLYNDGQAFSVVVQSDGRIVVGGQLPGQNLALVRLRPDGSLDTTFGDAGTMQMQLGAANTGLQGLALQPDGKIVGVTSPAFSGPQGFAVLRYLASGALDPSFGDAGVATTDFGPTLATVHSIRLLPDGRIVTGGQSAPNTPNPNTDFALARFNADGSLDTSFGSGGKVTVDVRGTVDRGGYVALSSSGKIIVAGQSATDPPPSATPATMSAVQLNSDGSLDTGFADGGKAVTTITGAAYTATFDGVGRAMLGGNAPGGFGILRFATSGAFDSAFGDGGLVTTAFSGGDTVAALLVQQDARVIATGSSLDALGNFSIAAARYLADGRLDDAFAAGGKSLTPPPPNADISASAAATSGCAFVTVSTFGYSKNTLPSNAMGVARFRR